MTSSGARSAAVACVALAALTELGTGRWNSILPVVVAVSLACLYDYLHNKTRRYSDDRRWTSIRLVGELLVALLLSPGVPDTPRRAHSISPRREVR